MSFIYVLPLLLISLWIMYSDIRLRRIPNAATLLLFMSALIVGSFYESNLWLWQIVMSVLSAGLLLLVRAVGNWLLQQNTMGMGDSKMAGALGAWLGFMGFVMSLFIASLLAVLLVYGARSLDKDLHGKHIPLGFYLGLATITLIGLHYFTPALFDYFVLPDPLEWL